MAARARGLGLALLALAALGLALAPGRAALPGPGGTPRAPPARGGRASRRQQQGDGKPLILACSDVAALAGRNKFQPMQKAWRGLIKKNFNSLYSSLAKKEDPRLLTDEDILAEETKKMKPVEQIALRRMREKAVADENKQAVFYADPRTAAPGLTKESAKVVMSQIMKQRGWRSEKRGLHIAEKAEKTSAVNINKRVATLEKELIEVEQKQVETTVDEVAVQRAQEELKAEIQALGKQESALSSPFIVRPSGMFKSTIAPGLLLRGKIDALRTVEGASSSESEMHIIEHKARQRKLFNAVREYEEIQCLGYIHLVQDHNQRERNESPLVRCILVETFGEDSSRHEILENPDLWHGKVLDVIRRRAEELTALVRGGPSASDLLSWLERL